jgi:hypothetical protein
LNRYTIKPKADQDLDQYALRFLTASSDTFALLAGHPEWAGQRGLQYASLAELRVFRVTGFEHMPVLYRPARHGVDILRVVHGSMNLRSLFRRRTEIE